MKLFKTVTIFLFAASLCGAQQSLFFTAKDFAPVLDSMNFPEGPAYDYAGSVYVSSCYGGFIKKIRDGNSNLFVTADSAGIKQTNGLTFFKDGSLFACDFGRGAILRIFQNGKVNVIADAYEGKRFNRPNDLAFDSEGNLYFSDPKSSDTLNPDGRVFCIDYETKSVKLILEGIAYPNGIAFSKNNKNIYLCESAKNRVLKFDVSKSGSLINKKVFANLPGGSPDGIALDEQSNLYVAHFGGKALYVIDQNGKTVEKLETPGKKPSNIEFAGEDLKTLFLTEDETNKVYTIRTKNKGLPLQSSPSKK